MSRFVRLPAFAVLAVAPLWVAQAGTVHGTVTNGTTGKPAAGIEVILIQLQGGMQPVANAKTDANGAFTFDNPGLGAQPMLVRAVYHGVNFHQPLPPGSSNVQVNIFESSADAKTINVPSHVVVFQPNGATLVVGEEYEIENKSQPPQAYFKESGNFDFSLPEKAQLQQVAASGPAGMPVVQAPIDKKNNHYSIAYAFRPGQSKVRFSYEVPYPGNAATVKIPTIYPGGRFIVVAPATVQVSGQGLAAGGQEMGMRLYGRDDVPAGTVVAVNLSGTAPPPDAGGGGAEQEQQGRDAQQGGGEAAGVGIQPVPGRLDVLKWPVIIGFACVFALGAISLARKPVMAVAGGVILEESVAVAKPEKAKSPVGSASRPIPATSLADVDAVIGTSLDALKERLFRLELRHQAGTISEEEYSQERARAEKVLRDLVRG